MRRKINDASVATYPVSNQVIFARP